MREDMQYEMTESIASVEEEKMAATAAKVLHPVSLAFEVGSAAKEPSQYVVLQLSEEILKDGMKSSTEPLLIFQPEELKGSTPEDYIAEWQHAHADRSLPIFSVWFVKGASRAATALCLLHLAQSHSINLRTELPHVWASLQAIYAHHLPQPDQISWVFANAKLSARGAIRRLVACD